MIEFLQTHKYIFGLPSQDCFKNDQSCRYRFSTILDPVAWVNVSKLTEYGDFPSTHGDIPVVFCLVYEIGFQATRVFFKIPTHGEHRYNFGCSKFRGCRFHNLQLYVLYVRILSRREKNIYCGIQYNSAIQLLLATSSLLDLHTRNIIQMSNDFRGTRPLVNLRSLENVSRRENTAPTPVTCKFKIWTAVLIVIYCFSWIFIEIQPHKIFIHS